MHFYFLIIISLLSVNACKYYIQLEYGEHFSLKNSTIPKDCEYEFLTRNNLVVEAQCKVGGCGTEFYVHISKQGYNLLPEHFNCIDSVNKTSDYQRLTVRIDQQLPFNCKIFTKNSTKSWGWSRNPKNISNQIDNISQFPYYVAQVYIPLKTIFCGGSIINEYWILTAAHCYTIASAKTTAIISGTDTIDNYGPFARTHYLSLIIQHEKFNSTGFVDNDIALAKVIEPFEWSIATGPINLPYHFVNQKLYGQDIYVMGFGHTFYKGYNSKILLKAILKIGTEEDCQRKWGFEYDAEKQMCMVPLPNEVTDACQNDSGGPVVLSRLKDYQISIISFGDGCGKGDPAVNVKVSAYLDWIQQKSGFNGSQFV